MKPPSVWLSLLCLAFVVFPILFSLALFCFDDSALAYLPLESENHEFVQEDTIVIVEEHGGTWTFLTLCLLSGIALIRRAPTARL